MHRYIVGPDLSTFKLKVPHTQTLVVDIGTVCISGVGFPVMNLNDSAGEGILAASWAFALGFQHQQQNHFDCSPFLV